MVLRNPTLLPLCMALVLAANGALAGGTVRHGEQRSQSESLRDSHHHRKHDNRGVASPGGLPSVIPGLGTFSGGISGVRIKGVGNYFLVSGGLLSADEPILAPKAKIIEVEGNDACSYEAGVCVVRP